MYVYTLHIAYIGSVLPIILGNWMPKVFPVGKGRLLDTKRKIKIQISPFPHKARDLRRSFPALSLHRQVLCGCAHCERTGFSFFAQTLHISTRSVHVSL